MASIKLAWIKKYGEEEGLKRWEERKKLSATTEQTLKTKYGEEEGLKRWLIYKDKLSKRFTKDWYINKYGLEEGIKQYKIKNAKLSVSHEALSRNGFTSDEIIKIRKKHAEKSVRSIDNFIKKYGEEEGRLKYDIYREKNRLNSSWGLNHWITKYPLHHDIAKKKLNEHQSRNIKWWIAKYGDVDGVAKFTEWVGKTTKAIMTGDSVSKGQKALEDNIREIYNGKVLGYKEQYGLILTNEEKNDFKISNSILYPDIILPEVNIIIRFHGDFWHASPTKFNDEDIIVPRINKTVKEIRRIDREKDKLYHNRGYTVIIVWETDYNKNKIEVIKNIKTKINENSKKRD